MMVHLATGASDADSGCSSDEWNRPGRPVGRFADADLTVPIDNLWWPVSLTV
jgi:hypothetical protein